MISTFAAKCLARYKFYYFKHKINWRISLICRMIMFSPPFLYLTGDGEIYNIIRLIFSIVISLIAGLMAVHDFNTYSKSYKIISEIYIDTYNFLIDNDINNINEKIMKEKLSLIPSIFHEIMEPNDYELTNDIIKNVENDIKLRNQHKNDLERLQKIEIQINDK